MNKYWFTDLRSDEVVTIVANSIEEATELVQDKVGHGDVKLFAVASI